MKTNNALKLLNLMTRTVISVGTTCIVAGAIWIGAQAVETKYFPVATDLHVTEEISHVDDQIVLAVSGNKVRDCKVLSLEGLSGNHEIPVLSKITILRTDGATPPQMRSRPTGYQDFGKWIFRPAGDYVKVTVRHDCGMPWTTVSDFFVWSRERINSPTITTNRDNK